MASAMKDIKSMRKLDKNRHGGYDYVPVDDVYDEVRKVLSKHGLTVAQMLCGPSTVVVAPTGKNGKEEHWIKQDFNYSIIFQDDAWEIGGNSSMARMSMGSQACGSNSSYGMKNFLRSTFLIPMGEYDIDSGEHEEMLEAREKSAKKSAKKDYPPKELVGSGPEVEDNDKGVGKEAADDFIDRFTKKLNKCKDVDAVRLLYKEELPFIKKPRLFTDTRACESHLRTNL